MTRVIQNISIYYNKNKGKFLSKLPFTGPSVEIRTRGLLNPIQARYQTSPHPETYLVLLTCNLDILAQYFPFVNNYLQSLKKYCSTQCSDLMVLPLIPDKFAG